MSERERPIVLNGRAAARAEIGGVERWARELIPRLRAMRPDLYRAAIPPSSLAHRAGQGWEQVVLPARAARLKAELIFSPADTAPLAWPRNVVVVHDAAPLRVAGDYSPAFRLWHNRVGIGVARRARAVITVSEFSRGELLALSGIDGGKLHVIHPGVDARFRSHAGDDDVIARYGLSRPYVLTVGTNAPRKNLRVLADIAGFLADNGLQTVWAGGDRHYIAGEDSLPRIRKLGYVADADLPALYGGAHAFVLPSRYEGFGLPCLEAMAAGTPVVAARSGALPEACGDAAVLVDPEDSRAMAQSILAAATDDELRRRLRSAGSLRAEQLTWERTAERVDALLTRVARSA